MKKVKAILLAAMVMPTGIPEGITTRAIDRSNDDPVRLSPETPMEMNLSQLHQKSKRSVKQVASPWSDVTWKANKGFVGERYRDERFGDQKNWSRKSRYLNKYNTSWVLQRSRSERADWVDSLSPAEKYDLVVGLASGGLSDSIVGFLDGELGNDDKFPSWWGLCEGSAVSTMYYPEPTRKVVLHSETYGIDVPFYATDIKGLATMLWSRFNSDLFLPESGLQCRSGGTGCFDTNPASFHALIHHFLDLSPGILVGEMDPSPVVWNFPIVAYSESYYRPDRGADHTRSELKSAAIRLSDWDNDPRARRRAPGTVYVVGIKMRVSYGVNRSGLPPAEGSLKRKINSRELVYELELDSRWNMIGGEWVSGKHPDLLWTLPADTKPDTPGENWLPPEWTDNGTIPSKWAEAARMSAARMTPLRRVVEILVKRSAKQR